MRYRLSHIRNHEVEIPEENFPPHNSSTNSYIVRYKNICSITLWWESGYIFSSVTNQTSMSRNLARILSLSEKGHVLFVGLHLLERWQFVNKRVPSVINIEVGPPNLFLWSQSQPYLHYLQHQVLLFWLSKQVYTPNM